MRTDIKAWLLAILLVPFLSSCDKRFLHAVRTSYVQVWYELEELGCAASETEADGVPYWRITVYNNASRELCSLYPGNSNDLYRSYCEDHGDVSYPAEEHVFRSWTVDDGELYNTSYMADDFVSVDVVAVDDWDEDSPAGSSMAGIAYFTGQSIREYVENGYLMYDYSSDAADGLSPFFRDFCDVRWSRPEWPVDKRLEEVSSDDLYLLGSGFFPHEPPRQLGWSKSFFAVYIPARPEPYCSRPCRVEVRCTTASGRIYTAEVEIGPADQTLSGR